MEGLLKDERSLIEEGNKLINACLREEGLDIEEDNMQECWVGLLRGLRKFDAQRGVKWSTYVWWWIRKYAKNLKKEKICDREDVKIEDLIRCEMSLGLAVVENMDGVVYKKELRKTLIIFMRDVLKDEILFGVMYCRLLCEKEYEEIAELLDLEIEEVVRKFIYGMSVLKKNKEELKKRLMGGWVR